MMTRSEALTAIDHVLSNCPDLCAAGYRVRDVSSRLWRDFDFDRSCSELKVKADEFLQALSYLLLVPAERRARIIGRGSYCLKEIAEAWGRSPFNPDRHLWHRSGYVSNGVLIAAALHLQFPVMPCAEKSDRRSPNALIGVGRGLVWPKMPVPTTSAWRAWLKSHGGREAEARPRLP